jgi:enamine deaminase RidA (YjgF/YER057c/UK114 family)
MADARSRIHERLISLGAGVLSHQTNRIGDDLRPLLTVPPYANASVAQRFVFGKPPPFEYPAVTPDSPDIRLIANPSPNASLPSGVFVNSIEGIAPRDIINDGAVIGREFRIGDSTIAFLNGILPSDARASRTDQTQQVFERIETALRSAGLTFANVARTWFYLDDILDWYNDFNRVRSSFFKSRGISFETPPASTGIGLANAAGAALTASVIAVKNIDYVSVASPLQNPAGNYGSAFSRAAEFNLSGGRLLTISGTASIDLTGATVFAGDIDRQIEQTMRVVKAILDTRGMDWRHAVRAIIYYRRAEDSAAFDAFCKRQSLPPLPAIPVCATVCRDDLLFEIEIDAWLSK